MIQNFFFWNSNGKRHVQKNISVALRSWWDSDRIKTIIDPVQHSASSVSLDVSSQYSFMI